MLGTLSAAKRHPAMRYLAQKDDYTVAVKTVKATDQAALLQLLMEMRLLATIEHDNIVKLLAVQEGELPILMVMEYCQGGDLKSCLRAGAGLLRALGMNVALAVAYLDMITQVACGLEYLHSKLCIHRDLAARNILVAKLGNGTTVKTKCGLLMKLSDVGLTRILRTEDDYYKVGSKWRNDLLITLPLSFS